MKKKRENLEPSTDQDQQNCLFAKIKTSVKKRRARFRHNDVGFIDSLFDVNQLSDLTGW